MTSMPHPSTSPEQIVLGVDTHGDVHVAAVITTVGTHVADAAFATTAAGYRRLLSWACRFGVLHRAGIEGTGCYGMALARYLRRQGLAVIEVNRPDRAARRRHAQDRHRRRGRRRPRGTGRPSHRHRQER